MTNSLRVPAAAPPVVVVPVVVVVVAVSVVVDVLLFVYPVLPSRFAPVQLLMYLSFTQEEVAAPDASTKNTAPADGQPLGDITNQTPTDKPKGQKHTPPADGIPSKTKVMVANLPYDLSEDKVRIHNFAMLSLDMQRPCR